MRKQLTKGFAMLMLVMALAFATAVVSANGQSLTTKANVPFDFIVGDKTMPAGDYSVRSMNSSGDALKIGCESSNQAAVRLTIPASGTSKSSKLVFHRYGQRYFLAEVWSDGGAQGRELAKSKQERAIEKEGARIAALNGEAPRPTYETVAITVH